MEVKQGWREGRTRTHRIMFDVSLDTSGGSRTWVSIC